MARENIRLGIKQFLEEEFGQDEMAGRDFAQDADAIVAFVVEQITIALNEEV